jgi:hypothetical protein
LPGTSASLRQKDTRGAIRSLQVKVGKVATASTAASSIETRDLEMRGCHMGDKRSLLSETGDAVATLRRLLGM